MARKTQKMRTRRSNQKVRVSSSEAWEMKEAPSCNRSRSNGSE